MPDGPTLMPPIRVGDRVTANPHTWVRSEFDAWGAGLGIGVVVDLPDDGTADVRWPGGREFRELDQLVRVGSHGEWFVVEYRFDGSDRIPRLDWGGYSQYDTLDKAREKARLFLDRQPGWHARITRVIQSEVVEEMKGVE